MNKENLAKLRDFLLENKDIIDFDMWGYSDEDLQKGEVLSTQCNTSACAIGWAPCVVPPDVNDHDIWHTCGNLRYQQYAKKYLFDDPAGGIFSSFWETVDNSAEGAAFRIDELIQAQKVWGFPETVEKLDEYFKVKQEWLNK